MRDIAASGFYEFQPGRAAHHCCLTQPSVPTNSRSIASLPSRRPCVPSTLGAGERSRKNRIFNASLFRGLHFASANVSTLHPRHEEQAFVQQGFATTPRATLLDTLFVEEDLAVICLQEGRLKNQGKLQCYNYVMYIAAATPRGAGGVQVWIARKLAKYVTAVVVETPWLMQVILTIGHISLAVFAAHAPCEGHANCCVFWDALTCAVMKAAAAKNTFVFIGVDANAHLGSITSTSVGPCQEQVENQNGLRLRMLAEEARLLVTNTFWNAGPTWTGARGHKSRIDYFLVPLEAVNTISQCEVLDKIDLATGVREDHAALAVLFDDLFSELLPRAVAPKEERHLEPFIVKRFTKRSLNDPVAVDWFQTLLWRYRPCLTEASVSPAQVEKLAADTIELLKWAAEMSFEPVAAQPRQKWISENTWAIITWGCAARKQLRSVGQRVRDSILLQFLRLWRLAALWPPTPGQQTTLQHEVDDQVFLCRILRTRAVLERAVREAACARNAALLLDRRDAAEKAAVEGQRASDHGDSKTFFRIVRSLAGAKPAAAAAIQDENGVPLTSAADTIARWRAFFAGVFKGEIVDSLDTIVFSDDVSLESVEAHKPSFDDVEGALSSLRADAGLGLDNLAASVLRAGGFVAILMFQQLLGAILSTGMFPLFGVVGGSFRFGKAKGSPRIATTTVACSAVTMRQRCSQRLPSGNSRTPTISKLEASNLAPQVGKALPWLLWRCGPS